MGTLLRRLSFYLLKAWRVSLGDLNEYGLRAPSAIYATLTLVPFYCLVRHTLHTRLGRTVACGLMACSFMQLQYTREARPYALLCLMTISALACVPALARRRSWRALIGFSLFTAAGLYSHNMMLFYGLGLAIAWLAWPGERPAVQRLTDMLIAGGIVALLYAPWLPVLQQQSRSITGTFWAARPDWDRTRVAISAVSGIDVYGCSGAGWALLGRSISPELAGTIVAICMPISIGVALITPGRRRMSLAIVGFVVVPFLAVWFISQVGTSLFMERAFISSSAVVPILIALPLETTRRWPRKLGGACVLMLGAMAIVSSVTLFAFQQKEDWRRAYEYVASLPPSQKRLIVFVANEGELPFDFYHRNDVDRWHETGAPHGFFGKYPPRTIQQVKDDRDLTDLHADLAGVDDVVLILSHDGFSDPHGLTEAFLSQWGQLTHIQPLRGIRVLHFVAGTVKP